MTEEVIKQRIKYLVEHGEVYPRERRKLDRRMVGALLLCIVMNIIQCVQLWMLAK